MAKSDKEKSAEEIRKKIDFLKSMEEKLVKLDYKIPFGRFLDRDGVIIFFYIRKDVEKWIG